MHVTRILTHHQWPKTINFFFFLLLKHDAITYCSWNVYHVLVCSDHEQIWRHEHLIRMTVKWKHPYHDLWLLCNDNVLCIVPKPELIIITGIRHGVISWKWKGKYFLEGSRPSLNLFVHFFIFVSVVLADD